MTYAKLLKEIKMRVAQHESHKARRNHRRWFTEEELRLAAQILNFYAPQPPRCICGQNEYVYGIMQGRLVARCKYCNFKRVYNKERKVWSQKIR